MGDNGAPLLTQGQVLNGMWKVERRLGAGACGEVYSVSPCSLLSKKVPYECVMKACAVVKGKTKKDQKAWAKIANTIYFEYILYQGVLNGFPMCPRFPLGTAYGEWLGVRFLVMERFEGDLMELSRAVPGPSLRDVASYGTQILTGLEELHKRRYVFIDVKPDNFMYQDQGGPDDNKRIVFIDFGLAQDFTDVRTQKHREETSGNPVGTPTFMSLAVHCGTTPSRRDDCESLGLVLLSMLMGGVLPWSAATSEAECLAMKKACDVRALAASVAAPELGEMILACRDLGFKQLPDYAGYKSLLSVLAARTAKATPSLSKPQKARMKAKSMTGSTGSRGSGDKTQNKAGTVISTSTLAAMAVEEESHVGGATGRRASARLSRESAGSSDALPPPLPKPSGPCPPSSSSRRKRPPSAGGVSEQYTPLKRGESVVKAKTTRRAKATDVINLIDDDGSGGEMDDDVKAAARTNDTIDTTGASGVAPGAERRRSSPRRLSRGSPHVPAPSIAPRGAHATLTVVAGPCVNRVSAVHIGDGHECSVGRHHDQSLSLKHDNFVSWEHAVFRYHSTFPARQRRGLSAAELARGFCEVEDQGSTNGIEFEGRVWTKGGPLRVGHGAQITVGDTVISITLSAE